MHKLISTAAAVFALSTLALGGTGACAAAYPDAPVRIILGFPPGNATDNVARVFASELSGELHGANFVVENRAGAAGAIGTSAVAKAAPDGLTLLVGSNGTLAINPWLYQNLAYDPIKDLTPITQLVMLPMYIVVNPSVPARNLAELIALAKKEPGELTFGSSGKGSANHLAAAVFASTAGIQLMHVPYKGSSPALTDLLAGRLTMMIDTAPAVLPYIKAGKLRVLAVTKPTRTTLLPDVPIVSESGYPGFDVQAWLGLLAPANTPKPIVDALAAASAKVIASDAFRKKMDTVGAEPAKSSPADFAAYMKTELVRWGKVVKDNHIEKQ